MKYSASKNQGNNRKCEIATAKGWRTTSFEERYRLRQQIYDRYRSRIATLEAKNGLSFRLSGLRLIENLSDGTQEEFSSGGDPEPSSG